MASLFVTEFRGQATGSSGAIPIPYGYLGTQILTIGSEADSVAFNVATRVVRVWAETACRLKWGAPEQTATTSAMPLNTGQEFSFGIDSGDEISVIAAS